MAADEEDLSVVSTVLQDAVVKIKDLAYDPASRRFAFVANRFVWECATGRKHGPFARVRVGCHFDDVETVQQQRLRLDANEAVLELLAVRFEAADDGAGAILLDFAGGGSVKLLVEAINISLSDVSEPWPTQSKPEHPSV